MNSQEIEDSVASLRAELDGLHVSILRRVLLPAWLSLVTW